MKLIVVVLLFLFINLNLIYSIDCPTGFTFSTTNGCVNGSQIISSGLCFYGNKMTVIILGETDSNPCLTQGSSAIIWFYTNIQNNSFKWKTCSIPNSYPFNQVGACSSDPNNTDQEIASETIQFTNEMRYFVAFSCYKAAIDRYVYSGELSSTPIYSSVALATCQSTNDVFMGYSVFDYHATKCPIGYEGIWPSCNDINECLDSNGGCSQICNNYDGGFNCSCNYGFHLESDNKTCIVLETCNDSSGLNECNHYISSVIPSTIKGGEASFIGQFSDNHKDIKLSISNTDCQITYNSSNLIKCTAVEGTGFHNVTLIQNGITFIGVNIYQYRPEILSCLNNCNSDKQQGACNTTIGECDCLNGYTGFDCTISPTTGTPTTNSTIDPNTGGTEFTNEQTNFQIYIKYLYELDFNGNKIKSFQLKDKWTLNNTENNNGNNIYKFDQMLSFDLISNKSDSLVSGCKVTSIIEEIKDPNGKEFLFGGTNFRVDNGLIKYSISISNYTYSSFLNTLQLELVSSVNDLNQDKSNCNTKDTETNSDELSSFNYIKITKNNKIFSGRFINYLISDGRPTFFKSTAKKELNSIIISLNLPHFKDNCLIDPDFSVLVSPDFKSSCDSSSNRKWVIPVAVVVSVVGAATLFTILFLILKKSTSAKIVVQKLKRLHK